MRRLVKSCPKKTYTMNDANYAEEVQMLLADSMSLECDMSHMAINYLLLEKCGKGNENQPECCGPLPQAVGDRGQG